MSGTTVTINGTTYELNGISGADADKLYADLAVADSKYSHIADQMATIIANYQSVVQLDIPSGVDPKQFLTDMMDKLKTGTDALTPEMKKVYGQLKNLPGMGKAFESTESAANTIGAILKFASDTGIGFKKGITLPWHVGGAIAEAAGQTGNWIDGTFNAITPEQAKHIATVYAAANYWSSHAPGAPDVMKQVDISQAGWWDKTIAFTTTYGSNAWDWISSFCSKVWKFCTNGWDWAKACADVEKENAGKEQLTYEQRLEKRLNGKANHAARTAASDILAQVDEVDGVSTKNISSLIGKNGIYRDNDGHYNTLSFEDDGSPKSNPILDKDGKPVTATNSHFQKLIPDSPTQAVVEGLVGGNLLHGITRGTMSKMVGKYTAEAKQYEKLMKPINELRTRAAEAETGILKDATGKVTGSRPINLAEARTLKAEATAQEIAHAPELKALKDKMTSREALFGTKGKAFAESENLASKVLTKVHPKLGGLGNLDFVNRGGALGGKLLGKFGDKTLTALETKSLHKTKWVYAVDAFQGGSAFVLGDWHGVAENTGEIAGAWAGAKYLPKLGEKGALKLVKMAPGKSKLIVGGAIGLSTIAGFFGGHKVGEYVGDGVGNVIAPKNDAHTASMTQMQKDFIALDEGLKKQGVYVSGVSEEMLPALRTAPASQEAQTKLLQQLQQQGVIPADMAPDAQVKALQTMQRMVQIQDAAISTQTKEEKRVEAGTTTMFVGLDAGINSAELAGRFSKAGGVTNALKTPGTGFFAKLVSKSPALSKVCRFAPGPVTSVIAVAGDVWEGGEAAVHGDGKQVVRSGGRVAGGLGGMWAGAATGAAICSVVPGIGTVAGFIIGGCCSAIGAWLGSEGGGMAADAIVGKKKPEGATPAVAGGASNTGNRQQQGGQPIIMDEGIAAALNDPKVVKAINEHPEFDVNKLCSTDKQKNLQTAQELSKMSGVKIFAKGVTVTVGATVPDNTSMPPTPAASPSASMPLAFS